MAVERKGPRETPAYKAHRGNKASGGNAAHQAHRATQVALGRVERRGTMEG